MVHPLLLSLTNIDANIHSKGSLHAHVLLALLPVVSFIHQKTLCGPVRVKVGVKDNQTTNTQVTAIM